MSAFETSTTAGQIEQANASGRTPVGVTEIVAMPTRGHAPVIDSGRREVADTVPAFVRRFT